MKAIRSETRFPMVWLLFEPCTKRCYALLIHLPQKHMHVAFHRYKPWPTIALPMHHHTSQHWGWPLNFVRPSDDLKPTKKSLRKHVSKWDSYEIRQYLYAIRINSWCNSTSVYTMPVLFPVHAKQPSYFFIEWPVVFSHLIHILDTEILIPRSKPLSWYVRRSWPTRKGNK